MLNKENAMNVRLEGNWKFLNTPSLVNFERRAIGYDRLFKRIIDMPENDNQSYPPHNLIKESDTEFKIELALAGFSKEEVKVVQEEAELSQRHLILLRISKSQKHRLKMGWLSSSLDRIFQKIKCRNLLNLNKEMGGHSLSAFPFYGKYK